MRRRPSCHPRPLEPPAEGDEAVRVLLAQEKKPADLLTRDAHLDRRLADPHPQSPRNVETAVLQLPRVVPADHGESLALEHRAREIIAHEFQEGDKSRVGGHSAQAPRPEALVERADRAVEGLQGPRAGD